VLKIFSLKCRKQPFLQPWTSGSHNARLFRFPRDHPKYVNFFLEPVEFSLLICFPKAATLESIDLKKVSHLISFHASPNLTPDPTLLPCYLMFLISYCYCYYYYCYYIFIVYNSYFYIFFLLYIFVVKLYLCMRSSRWIESGNQFLYFIFH
jgi:hypothetical protein